MIVLIALCFCMTSMFINAEKQQKYVPAVILKGLASLSFVILGFMNSSGTAAPSKIVAGLVLGCIADVLLNLRYVAKEKGKPVFLTGILVFLSGHILYLLAVFPMNTDKIFCIILSVILTALLMKWIFTKITAEKAFKIFGIFYIGAIVLLNCCAWMNMFASPSSFAYIFAAGAFLFLISDIVLILNTFGPETKFSLRVTNLSLYYIGQILIALSLLFLK